MALAGAAAGPASAFAFKGCPPTIAVCARERRSGAGATHAVLGCA